MLKTGDPCPCCGQPIKTNDPATLALLTYIQDNKCNKRRFYEFVSRVGEIGLDAVIEEVKSMEINYQEREQEAT